MKSVLKSQLLRHSALAAVLGVGLVGCSDGSDSYFGWGDPGAWYESAAPGEGDPNLDGASVPGDRLPDASRGPALDLGGADDGIEYADSDVRGSESGTLDSGPQTATASAPREEGSPLIASARTLGEVPPAPKIDAPADEKPTAAATKPVDIVPQSKPVEVAAVEPETPKKNYTAIPKTTTLGGARPVNFARRAPNNTIVPKGKDAPVVARLMDRGNPDIPGPMPFAGSDGTVRGYPGDIGPAPQNVPTPAAVRTASAPALVPAAAPSTTPANAAPKVASNGSGPRSIGQYIQGGDTPTRAAPLKSAAASNSMMASSSAPSGRKPLVPIAGTRAADAETSLEKSAAGSFSSSFSEVAGRDVSNDAVTIDMTALDERKASVPQELIADLNNEFGGGNPTYQTTRADLQFDGGSVAYGAPYVVGGTAPMAAPTMAVEQRRETLAALIPPERAAATQARGAYIGFALGSVRLSQQDRAAITKLASAVAGTPRVIRVVGHAADPTSDTHGGVDGFDLSLERANKVAAALVAAGVPHNQLRVEARGVTGARRAELYLE
ncbi:MAG: OmpA family protein [Alphaproteobacteria bacterium]